MVAVVGLHRLAQLALRQGHARLDEGAHQAAAAVHHGAVGQEGVALGGVELVGLRVPAVVALLVHGRVKGGNGILRPLDLRQQGVGLGLHLRLLLVGNGAAILILREGQQDVLAAVNALGVDHVFHVLVGGGELPGLGVLGLQLAHQHGDLIGQLLIGGLGNTLLVQVLLEGDAVVHFQGGGHALHLAGNALPVLVGEGDSLLIDPAHGHGVQLAVVQGRLFQVVAGGGAVDLLLPGGIVGQVAAVLGLGDGVEQPVQILVGHHILPVGGVEHRVPGDTGGLVGDIVGGRGTGGGGVGGLVGAAGQGPQQQRTGQARAQELLPIHRSKSSLFAFSRVQCTLFPRFRQEVPVPIH